MSLIMTNSSNTVRIQDGTVRGWNYKTVEDTLVELEGNYEKLREEVVEAILLSEARPVAVSPYEMSYEEYMELPCNARL